MRRFLTALILCLGTAASAEMAPRKGWSVLPTAKTHATLLSDLKKAVKANGMGVVTQAGPTGTARKRGIDIPENRVVGVFNNDFAVRILALSTPAMIEAPIRFYVTENADGTATLSYKTPGFVFAPYVAEGGPELEAAAADLDVRFAKIANAATN
ncbi:DUF302 domain-containing protein [Roseobacter sp. S98]|uniref:DUF302 domain-containing protein n=1 Tax=Roseobacter algicola (ex Choi et al. 2025) (nom. illeg.) TaxID=3092138 RepID=UPI003F50DCEA